MDREASDKELEKNLPTLKDNDFIKQRIRLDIGEQAKVKLMEMLNADVNVRDVLHFVFTFCFLTFLFPVPSQVTFNGLFTVGWHTR